MQELLTALAEELPVYHLPPAVTAHSRHYMPIGGGTTTKVLDTFVHVGDGAVAVDWDTTLSPAALDLFEELARNMSYLGRAESWIEASVLPSIDVRPESHRVFPENGYPQGPGWEQISLLAALPGPEYGKWRDGIVDRDKEVLRAAGKVVNPPAVRKINALYPETLTACLLVTTPWLQKHGWSQPPGSRRVLYWRPAAALEPPRPHSRSRHALVPRQSCALLALASNTEKKEVLPLFRRALPQAELLHASFVGWLSKAGTFATCPELTGLDPNGQPLQGHKHAHFIPLDVAGTGRIDHFLVYAPMGLGGTAQDLLQRVRVTHSKDLGELFVTLAGFGSKGDFADREEAAFAPLQSSRIWKSLTPFVPPRFPKKNKHTIAEQLNAELASRGFPPATVSFLDKETFVEADLHRFVRVRRNTERRPPVNQAFGVRLEFEEAQAGPIALGYASHFGLGLFIPAD
jgi:CRISPR-associated protein Csb2